MSSTLPSRTLCDAGPLIALAKLGQLNLLGQLYNAVTITQGVYAEVVTMGLRRGHMDAFAVRLFWQQNKWPVVTVQSETQANYEPTILLDQGERETLALALTFADPLVLIDDEAARDEARRLGLRVQGTLGIFVQAYRQRMLTYSEVELLVKQIAVRPDIWISAQLCVRILEGLQT